MPPKEVHMRRLTLLPAPLVLVAMAAACGAESPTESAVVEGSLLSVAGDGQVGSLGRPLSDSLIVKVANPSGDGVPGVTVRWSASSTGMVSSTAVVTDAEGLAKVQWTLGRTTGEQTATEQDAAASVSGVGSFFFRATTPSLVPLTDMGASTYFGFPGGLYPGGNVMPQAHADAGQAFAAAVEPLDANGNPSTAGKYVFLAIGGSLVEQVWCWTGDPVCPSNTFTGQALADAEVERTNLALVQGAYGGHGPAHFWDSPNRPDYDRIRDDWLVPRGLSEQQVQVLWMRVGAVDRSPFPGNGYDWVSRLGEVTRALRSRYPNLRLVFLMTFQYGGYRPPDPVFATGEPLWYENGFARKWLIQAQIDQMASGGTIVDGRAGDLNYNTVAPWIEWGPYFWADGVNPRSDGLFWSREDLSTDGIHLTQSGIVKAADILLAFFKTSPQTRCWFLNTGVTC